AANIKGTILFCNKNCVLKFWPPFLESFYIQFIRKIYEGNIGVDGLNRLIPDQIFGDESVLAFKTIHKSTLPQNHSLINELFKGLFHAYHSAIVEEFCPESG